MNAVQPLRGHGSDDLRRQKLLIGSWDYGDQDTQYLTHNIHRYSGKFIPQIAARAIDALTEEGELILDPYCGSGTTLVEAALAGRKAIGIDLNPLAVLISNVKVTPLRAAELTTVRHHLSDVVADLVQHDGEDLFSSGLDECLPDQDANNNPYTSNWFTKWFGTVNLRELVVIHSAIHRIADERARDVAMVAFSDILRRCSKAHSGYPNVMFDKNATERTRPSKVFLSSLDRVCALVSQLEKTEGCWSEVKAILGNATSMPLADDSVDAIVTHPPYIGSIPYAEYGLLSLKWLGVEPKDLDRELTGGRRQTSDVIERFQVSYRAMLSEAVRVLRPGRYACLVVGNPVVKGKAVDLEDMTRRLATGVGFELFLVTKRTGSNRRANKMGDESLLFFRKQ